MPRLYLLDYNVNGQDDSLLITVESGLYAKEIIVDSNFKTDLPQEFHLTKNNQLIGIHNSGTLPMFLTWLNFDFTNRESLYIYSGPKFSVDCYLVRSGITVEHTLVPGQYCLWDVTAEGPRYTVRVLV